MRVSILGPTNLRKFYSNIGLTAEDVEAKARVIGRTLARYKCEVVVVFNYEGMLKLVGDAYKGYGGKLIMLHTDNDSDWEILPYVPLLEHASEAVKKESWHDMLLSLVGDSEIVICTGLSAGVFVELGYMKWNYQDKKGKCKDLIGIKELLRDGDFPPEISKDIEKLITVIPMTELEKTLDKLMDKKEENT